MSFKVKVYGRTPDEKRSQKLTLSLCDRWAKNRIPEYYSTLNVLMFDTVTLPKNSGLQFMYICIKCWNLEYTYLKSKLFEHYISVEVHDCKTMKVQEILPCILLLQKEKSFQLLHRQNFKCKLPNKDWCWFNPGWSPIHLHN
jgi:hypothetical protein